MTARTSTRSRTSTRAAVALAATMLLGLGIATPALAAPALAADGAPLAKASGVEVVDIDGGTLTRPTPAVEWRSGEAVEARADGTTDVLKLNTTQTTGLRTTAGPDGAVSTIESGTFTLRDRPAVTFRDLRVACTPGADPVVTLGSLSIGGTDVTAEATARPGWSTDLPDSRYGPTRVLVGTTTTSADGTATTVGLRIDGDSGASEISRVRAGSVSCAPATSWPTPTPTPAPSPEPAPAPTPAPSPEPSAPPTADPDDATRARSVSGVSVTAVDGTVLVDGQPALTGTGTRTAERVAAADGSPSTGRGVTVTTTAEGTSDIGIDSFEQIPDAATDPVAAYRWPALRVYGLHAHVTPEGTMTVGFDDESSAVFVNGVWINTATDLYTGVDAEGEERVRMRFGERVVNPDGSTTLTALHYTDLTGTHPEVALGIVTLPPPAASPAPEARVTEAWGVGVTAADGSTLVSPQPRVTAAGDRRSAERIGALDGYPARATDVTATIGATGDTATLSVGHYEQVPGEGDDPVAEYRWPALKVNGLHAEVTAGGTMDVTFDDEANAVFVNGVWINTATDLYTGLDGDGDERVRVHVGERVENADGTVTLTALHYEDLTGTYPEVRLGQVTIASTAGGDPGDGDGDGDGAPAPAPGTDDPAPGRWYAYGLRSTGASDVGAQPLAAPAASGGPVTARADVVGDGGAGQLRVTGASVRSAQDRGAVRLDRVVLFPGTRLAGELRDVQVTVTGTATTVTTGGGRIAGTTIPAGPVAADTRIAVPGGAGTLVLNEQRTTGADRSVTAVHFTDRSGLGADVSAAVVTTERVDPPVGGGAPGGGDAGQDDGAPGQGGGNEAAPGALSPDGSSPAGTSGTSGTSGTGGTGGQALAFTGASVRSALIAAALLLTAGVATIALRRRRHSS
ncbi:hypothetical protein [Curtobacterium sp. MCPF17_046]|uniref:hypothetical protein n=1 Tax=Curtobacterium sp. MCPF17_046 TaxID=2175663 RepID=UPI000D9E78A4|nr:hypothetical protein [Curtobacterium sp. MCPF17_046]PYY39652.1 hypothetical protein DEJ32_07620 [Curtobacterium sp. MCPF17_046]